jgi:hypothetical protein
VQKYNQVNNACAEERVRQAAWERQAMEGETAPNPSDAAEAERRKEFRQEYDPQWKEVKAVRQEMQRRTQWHDNARDRRRELSTMEDDINRDRRVNWKLEHEEEYKQLEKQAKEILDNTDNYRVYDLNFDSSENEG